MMKKSLIALAALSAFAGAAQAQSGVNLYGIVDLGLRHSNNQGLNKGSENQETAGMSQSRWGINVNEDMGGGLRTLVNLESRFSAQNGAIANAAQWSQSWVGIQSSDFGQIRLGRQYNVLFDVMTTTYVPFKFSPYIEVFKPETIGHLSGGVTGLGSRNDNMVKYLATLGAFTFEAQVSALQGDPTLVKSWGAAAKYGFGELALGGGYLEETAINGGKAKAYNLGAGYTSGPLYLNASYEHSTFDAIIPSELISAATFGTALTIPFPTNVPLNVPGAIGKRDLISIGGTYNVTPALLLGGEFYTGKTQTTTGAGNGKADAFALVADYAFSKRTDAYFETDYVKLKDGAVLLDTIVPTSPATWASGATSRYSFMVGVRHRF